LAEKLIVVCDVCGEPAMERVTLKVRGRSLQKDLCNAHLTALTEGARPAKRGRPRAKAGAALPVKAATGPRRRRTRTSKAAA
jgi:hypothetical protein